MIHWSHVLAVLQARNREFFRDRSSLAWNLLFPLLLVVGMGLIFSGSGPELYKIGWYAQDEQSPPAELATLQYTQFVPIADMASGLHSVERHQLDMLLDPATRQYWINETSPKGYMLAKVLAGIDSAWQKQQISAAAVRYIDWLIPGILGMNMMFSALFGVGYVIVRYRKNGVLRRLKATPLSALEFLLAQVLSRLWIILVTVAALFFGSYWLIGFTVAGSYLLLLLVFTVGALSLISLGLLVAARVTSEELAGGLLNLCSWPMMLLSGVWFSLEGAPQWLQLAAQLLPLTHVIDAARVVMVDGAGIVEISFRLLLLTASTVLFLLLGAYFFRWE